jgi:ribulose-phosphate 3-epimerase
MAIICPTVTAEDSREYDRQVRLISKFAPRIHIDLMDGDFAPTISPSLSHVWWSEGVEADIHIMYRRPFDYLDQLIQLKPKLVIIHAEADYCFEDLLDAKQRLAEAGIKLGIAILANSGVDQYVGHVSCSDHVLIFSGNLGFHGGETDLNLLKKVADIKKVNQEIEIGWDGGVNLDNAKLLAFGGIEVLNVGSGVHHDKNGLTPEAAYDKLMVEIAG